MPVQFVLGFHQSCKGRLPPAIGGGDKAPQCAAAPLCCGLPVRTQTRGASSFLLSETTATAVLTEEEALGMEPQL